MTALPSGVEYRRLRGEQVLATRGPAVGEEVTADGWRAWDPSRSKLGAMLDADMEVGLAGGETVLYLGAAGGTTVSHVADFAGPTYAVEFAPGPITRLCRVAEDRPNLFPLLKDARRPETYAHVVEAPVDVIIQDVATRGQARVAATNRQFLAPDGRLLIAIKARSEDVTADPESVFTSACRTLESSYRILDRKRLDPAHRDHLAVVAEPREAGGA